MHTQLAWWLDRCAPWSVAPDEPQPDLGSLKLHLVAGMAETGRSSPLIYILKYTVSGEELERHTCCQRGVCETHRGGGRIRPACKHLRTNTQDMIATLSLLSAWGR